jgi:hypothetical protein
MYRGIMGILLHFLSTDGITDAEDDKFEQLTTCWFPETAVFVL